MTTFTLPNNLENEIKHLAETEQRTSQEMVLQLIQEALLLHKKQQTEEEEALQIHEQLMNQYAETFDKLAQ